MLEDSPSRQVDRCLVASVCPKANAGPDRRVKVACHRDTTVMVALRVAVETKMLSKEGQFASAVPVWVCVVSEIADPPPIVNFVLLCPPCPRTEIAASASSLLEDKRDRFLVSKGKLLILHVALYADSSVHLWGPSRLRQVEVPRAQPSSKSTRHRCRLCKHSTKPLARLTTGKRQDAPSRLGTGWTGLAFSIYLQASNWPSAAPHKDQGRGN
ncbi:hypothetical protein B0H67DRAFT_72899 [Lasiosphaeris hirsuta]|uniref:Uncharacterized protein n=1 Tax=Lasiosphaeris hirsuta TaxID=260670 RepID=A0AA40BBZ1_9PEZI|nr:hypothetical protein B0H67DRAFT_72899 [Lasiosphaeris hirsuta]